MKFHYAFTAPVNPPSATPTLTRAQVWQGLKIKARDPARFIPGVAACEVTEEREDGITRVIEFAPGGPPGKITETVKYLDGYRADFEMLGRDTFVSNIISDGSGESDLYLTFTFAFNFPDIQEGTPEAAEKAQKVRETAAAAVPMSLNEVRELVEKGEIKA